eukprot:gene26650-biopygen17068
MNSCHEEGVSRGIGSFDSSREHPPCDMSSSETGPCYGEIDEVIVAD